MLRSTLIALQLLMLSALSPVAGATTTAGLSAAEYIQAAGLVKAGERCNGEGLLARTVKGNDTAVCLGRTWKNTLDLLSSSTR